MLEQALVREPEGVEEEVQPQGLAQEQVLALVREARA